jgi:hypothetical protein
MIRFFWEVGLVQSCNKAHVNRSKIPSGSEEAAGRAFALTSDAIGALLKKY